MSGFDPAGVEAALRDLADIMPRGWTFGGIHQGERHIVGGPWRAWADGERGARLTGDNAATMTGAVRSLIERVAREFGEGQA